MLSTTADWSPEPSTKGSGRADRKSRWPAYSLVLLAGLGLDGCASGPKYRKPEP